MDGFAGSLGVRGRPGRLVVTGRVGRQGAHLVVCDGDVEQDGQAVASAVPTFAIVDTN